MKNQLRCPRFSTPRTLLHRTPDGRPIPGTFADDNELYAFADVLGRHAAVALSRLLDSKKLERTDGPQA